MNTLIPFLFLILTSFSHGAVLIVKTTSNCRFSVDGKKRGTLTPGRLVRIKLAIGDHKLDAVPVTGGGRWLQLISLESPKAERQVKIDLASKSDYCLDSTSGLMWTAADNGSGLSLSQAVRYCRDLRLNGFKDWELPKVEDLQSLFDGRVPANDVGFHLRAPLKLTGWQWSETTGQQQGEGWAFDFGDGGRASVAAGDSGLNRALCVRPIQNPR
jgi:hypothetical protein